MISAVQSNARVNYTSARVSPGEARVWGLLARGYSTGEAARVLGIKPKTIESYTNTLYSKLSLEDVPVGVRRVHLVLLYHGISPGGEPPVDLGQMLSVTQCRLQELTPLVVSESLRETVADLARVCIDLLGSQGPGQ